MKKLTQKELCQFEGGDISSFVAKATCTLLLAEIFAGTSIGNSTATLANVFESAGCRNFF